MLSVLQEDKIILLYDDSEIISFIKNQKQKKYVFILKNEATEEQITNIIKSNYKIKNVNFNDLSFDAYNITVGKRYYGPTDKEQIEGNLLIFDV